MRLKRTPRIPYVSVSPITHDEIEPRRSLSARDPKADPRRTDDFVATSDLARAAQNNIGWLYHNGGRYWNGYSAPLAKYPLSVLFTSFRW